MRYVVLCTVLTISQLVFSNIVVASESKTVATPAATTEATAATTTATTTATSTEAPTETASETQLPAAPWLQPAVLKAAVGIGMTQEQMPGFRAAVTDLVNNQTKAVNRVMRGNNVSNLKRKLRVANKRQFKKMDKSMAALLTDEQYPKYEVYRDLLSNEMKEATKRRSGTTADAMGVTSAGLDGYSDSQ